MKTSSKELHSSLVKLGIPRSSLEPVFICSLYHAALLFFRARAIVSVVCSFCPFVFLASPVYPCKSCVQPLKLCQEPWAVPIGWLGKTLTRTGKRLNFYGCGTAVVSFLHTREREPITKLELMMLFVS